MSLKKKRIGLLGGTFDPPTVAHFLAAQWAYEQAGLDEVRFLLNRRNPLKDEEEVTSPELRVEMIEKVTAGIPRFRIEKCELSRPAPSYTVDTLAYLTESEPDMEFVLLAGMDVVAGFDRWKDIERIFELVEVVVFPRGAYPAGDAPVRWLDRCRRIDIPLLEISATMIRDRVARDLPIRYLVPPPVEEIIHREGLYRP